MSHTNILPECPFCHLAINYNHLFSYIVVNFPENQISVSLLINEAKLRFLIIDSKFPSGKYLL